MSETLGQYAEIEPDSESGFTERELVLEKFTNTPMAHEINGVVHKANGSYQAILICDFLQDENMHPEVLEYHLSSAAEFRSSLPEDEEKQKIIANDELVDEKTEGTDDVQAELETPQDSTEQNTPVAEPSQHTATSEPLKVSIQKVVPVVQHPAPVVAFDESHDSELVPSSTPARPKLEADSIVINIEAVEKSDSDTVVPEPSPDEVAPDTANEAAASTATFVNEIEPDTEKVTSEEIIEPTSTAIAIPAVISLDTNEPLDTTADVEQSLESTIDELYLPPVIEASMEDVNEPIHQSFDKESELTESIEIDDDTNYLVLEADLEQAVFAVDSDETASQETEPITEHETEVADTQQELIEEEPASIETIDELHLLLENLSESEPAIAGIDDTAIALGSTTNEPPFESDLQIEPIEDTKIESLYQCAAAQIEHPRPEVLAEAKENNELPPEVTTAMIELLEEAGVPDPDLLLKLYIEEYGVSQLFDTTLGLSQLIFSGTNAQPTIDGNYAKLAQFVTHKLIHHHDAQFAA